MNIPRLMAKLREKGVGGRMMRTIVSMYQNRTSHVKLHGKRSRSFPVRRGVAQGCVLRPLLFNIYVDDLLQRFRETGVGVSVGKALLAALAFADDLVLGGENRTMRRYIQILEEWCDENEFSLNVSKCAMMPVVSSFK